MRLYVLLLALALIAPNTAAAYLDPGTGSYLFQLLLGALAGVSFAARVYWHRLKAFVARLFSASLGRKEKRDAGHTLNE